MQVFKDFKIAQIVPVSCLPEIANNHYHMCLAHLVAQSDEYANFYKMMSERGKFVLMDNGAAEGSQLTTPELLAMYDRINPTEIVIPDTLCDKNSTLAKAEAFVSAHSDLPYRFMAVPQGRDINEWCMCAAELLQRYPRINSIGISKFLNITTKDPYIRFTAANYIMELSERLRHPVEVHLLGCDEGPSIVREIQMEVPNVRGCDSAFAYIATQAGVKIAPEAQRPEGEIDFLDGSRLDGLADNMHRFEDAAGVADNANDLYWR